MHPFYKIVQDSLDNAKNYFDAYCTKLSADNNTKHYKSGQIDALSSVIQQMDDIQSRKDAKELDFKWISHPMPGWHILTLKGRNVAQLECFDKHMSWRTLEGIEINRRHLLNVEFMRDKTEDEAKAHVESCVSDHIKQILAQFKALV